MKDRVLVVSALLVLLVTNIAFAAPEWYAVQTDVLPTIDANFSDAVWTKAREYVIDRYIADDGGTLIELHSPIPHVNTGRFYLLWDSEYLCVYAKVTDQNVYTGAVRGEPTNGGTDVIQLCIEPLAWRAPTNTLAYIIDMTPGSGDDSGPLAWEHWQIQGNLDEVDIAAKATDSVLQTAAGRMIFAKPKGMERVL